MQGWDALDTMVDTLKHGNLSLAVSGIMLANRFPSLHQFRSLLREYMG